MNKIPFIVSGLCATIGFGLLWLYLTRLEQDISGGAPIAVLVAAQDIPLGTRLTPDMLDLRDLPSTYVDERHVRAADLQRVLGVQVSLAVRANESLLWTDVATTAQELRDLSELVQNGYRAVTVEAHHSSSFGGLLRPGDHVDVLLTAARAVEDRGGEKITIPLLQNVTVLAVGEHFNVQVDLFDPSASRGRRYNEVTLSTTVEEAQILTYAQRSGVLTFTLRNPDDIRVLDGLAETTHADVIEPARRVRLLRRESPPPPPPTLPTEIQ